MRASSPSTASRNKKETATKAATPNTVKGIQRNDSQKIPSQKHRLNHGDDERECDRHRRIVEWFPLVDERQREKQDVGDRPTNPPTGARRRRFRVNRFGKVHGDSVADSDDSVILARKDQPHLTYNSVANADYGEADDCRRVMREPK